MNGAERTRPRWSAEHSRFVAVMVIPALVIALGRLHGLPTAPLLDRHLSLMTAPRALQHTLGDILLVPIGALTVVIFRLTLGVHVLGPFRSILLAFAFLTTGIALGLLFLAVTVLILLLVRPVIKNLRLPYFGRVSVMISTVALVMVVGTLSGGWLQSPSLRNVAHFPIVVLVLVGEKVAVTIRRDGVVSGIWRASTTALIGVAVTGIASIPGLAGVLLAHPELLLVEIALIAVVSSVCDWRLLEWLNPKRRGGSQPRAGALSSTVPDLAGSSTT